MELKLLLNILTIIGIPAYIGAIILNISTWKAELLLWVALGMALVRFIFFCWKTGQIIRLNEIEIKRKRKELKEAKK